MHDAHIILGDGRRLAYTDTGDPGGPCLVFFHGAPLSRLTLAAFDETFAAAGLRVVSPDRPGYGGSSPQPGRALADWPADVAALADALGIGRFVAVGHSSGGPYAVACCALLPDRLEAGVVLAGVTDFAWPSAWEGYIPDEIEIMRQPDERAALAWCVEHYGTDGAGWLAQRFEMPAPDVALLADERMGDSLNVTLNEAFRQGVLGYAQDVHVQGRPWPFDPGRIAVPTAVVHGEQDTLVGMAHSRHTAELIPGASLWTLPGHGHLTTLPELPAIAAELTRGLPA